MSTITRLVAQKRDRERVSVYLDGEYAFGLALIEAIRLKVGQLLSDEEIATLQDRDAYHRAHARSLDYLSRRPRSQREMERYLQGKEVPEIHIESITARLTESGLLDDLAFARYWIENREAFRPRGALALRYELREKGVDEKIIDQALSTSEMDEVEGAYRVALQKLPRLRAIDNPWEFQQKLAGFLGRRGYGWDVIREVSDRLWEARDDENELYP